MLDAGRLATLRSVVASGSFSAAAESLSLTQPAVSRQVALLERQVGLQLVERTRRGVRPTEAGRLLVDHADVVVRQLARAEEELAELRGLRRGRVRLGSFFAALGRLSTELATDLGERHPELVIEDALVDRRAAFAGLAAGRLDVALVAELEDEPDPAPPELEVVPLFRDPPRVLLPAGHRLARRRGVRVGELAAETWLRPVDGSVARLIDRLLAAAAVSPPRLLAGRGEEPVELHALVAAGRGVTVAHDLTVSAARVDVAVRPLAGVTGGGRTIQAAAARGHRAPATRAVLEALREIGRRHTSRLAGSG
jgi:DNA-binding transcriptional LysR family regulator